MKCDKELFSKSKQKDNFMDCELDKMSLRGEEGDRTFWIFIIYESSTQDANRCTIVF